MTPDLSRFPGGELVAKGIRDLEAERCSEEALLVLISADNLSRLGLPVRQILESAEPFEHTLYRAVNDRNPKGAHAEYNALRHRLVSFEQTYARAVRGRTVK